MAYSMFVVGRLEIAQHRWLQLVGEAPDLWSFDGWLGDLRPHSPIEAESRSEVLRSLRAVDFCDCAVTSRDLGIRLDVSGWLRGGDFLDHGPYLAEVFIRTYALGGTGTLWFLAEQTAWGPQDAGDSFVLRCEDGQARLEHPSERKQTRVLGTRTYRALRDRVEKRLRAEDPAFEGFDD